MSTAETLLFDLDHPDRNPLDCPEWAKEILPPEMQRLRGRNGMPEPYRSRPGTIAENVRGIDRYHANQFLPYRADTADFIYSTRYSPTIVHYTPGLLPSFEILAAECTQGCSSDTGRAVALLTKGTPRVKHPEMAPCGHYVTGDRNLEDEALLASGAGWCNEQARVFIRLCQVSGIPARIVHLFYSNEKTGHCIAEFFADGRWCMADASYFCVFPGGDGHLMSAADCHSAEGRPWFGRAMHRRLQELLALSDTEIHPTNPDYVRKFREHHTNRTAEQYAEELHRFAFVNYPLPS